MPTTFDQDETSAARSRPIDLYTIQTASTVYRVTSHIADVVYGGNTFTAIAMSRGNVQVAQDLTGRELIVTLPITHPVVQRYAASGIPAQNVLVTLQRLQEISGLAMQVAQGYALGLVVEGHLAHIRVPSITDDAMQIKLPMIRAQTACNHMLFDPRCGKARAAYIQSNMMASQVVTPGRVTLELTAYSGASGYFTFGEVVRLADGERRQIIGHLMTTLTINTAFPSALPGDVLQLTPGCDHSLGTCKLKYANVTNFGGMPHLNSAVNPYNGGNTSITVQV